MTLVGALAGAPPPVVGRVVVALPDGTRPVDVPAALRALARYLPADALGLIGLGLHRPMRADELPASPIPLAQSDPDRFVPTRDVDGIRGTVDRRVAEADCVLGVGIVELHQYAGYSGGHKAVAVGCAGRPTLDDLHHRDRVTARGVEIGRIGGNPFRAAVDALGEAAGTRWCLLQAGDQWFAGEPRETLRRAAASLDCWWDVPGRHAAAVLRVPARKAVNFYQASRAATYIGLSPDPPLLPGATLYLDAACPEGMGEGSGEQAFAALLRAGVPPWGSLLTGAAPDGAGTQRAVMIALLLQRYRLVVCGTTQAAALRACGIDATALPAEAVAPPGALCVDDPFGKLPRWVGDAADVSTTRSRRPACDPSPTR